MPLETRYLILAYILRGPCPTRCSRLTPVQRGTAMKRTSSSEPTFSMVPRPPGALDLPMCSGTGPYPGVAARPAWPALPAWLGLACLAWLAWLACLPQIRMWQMDLAAFLVKHEAYQHLQGSARAVRRELVQRELSGAARGAAPDSESVRPPKKTACPIGIKGK